LCRQSGSVGASDTTAIPLAATSMVVDEEIEEAEVVGEVKDEEG
jgi:hypothetical protein